MDRRSFLIAAPSFAAAGIIPAPRSFALPIADSDPRSHARRLKTIFASAASQNWQGPPSVLAALMAEMTFGALQEIAPPDPIFHLMGGLPTALAMSTLDEAAWLFEGGGLDHINNAAAAYHQVLLPLGPHHLRHGLRLAPQDGGDGRSAGLSQLIIDAAGSALQPTEHMFVDLAFNPIPTRQADLTILPRGPYSAASLPRAIWQKLPLQTKAHLCATARACWAQALTPSRGSANTPHTDRIINTLAEAISADISASNRAANRAMASYRAAKRGVATAPIAANNDTIAGCNGMQLKSI